MAGKDLRIVATVGSDRTPDTQSVPRRNLHIEKAISHAAVLKRASILVSHAGHGAVMKALQHGVPMVLVPWGRDQPGVAARAEALGTATVIDRDNASAETISAAIDNCLSDQRMHAAAASQRRRLAEVDAQTLAADHVEALM